MPSTQLHRITRCPVLAGLFVIFLVEASYELLENRTHRMIVEAPVLHRPVGVQDRVGTQVQPRVEEFLDQRPECIRLRESCAPRLIDKLFRIDFVRRIGTADRLKRCKTIAGEVTQIGVSQADTG